MRGARNKLRTALWVSALAYVMLFGYSIARPAAESLFLERYGSAALPKVWVAVAVTAVIVVAIYNRAAARYSLVHVLLGTIAASATSLVVLLLAARSFPIASFALYVWKDVHIVVLLEILWSFANVVFETRTARWTYGLFCAAGTLGSFSGNMAVGKLAAAFGTAQSLWLLLIVFTLLALLGTALGKAALDPRPKTPTAQGLGRIGVREGVSLLRGSRYLGVLLLLVGTVQLVVNLIDFQYSGLLEQTYVDTDARTAVIGQVYGVIDVSSLLLQFATGAILRYVGFRKTMLAIPVLLGGCVIAGIIAPTFTIVAVTKIASKTLDYSLFRAAKELLYIPLSYAEKTRGKALVDMLTYRVSKAGASLLVAGLLRAGAALSYGTVVLIGAWGALAYVVAGRYRRLTRDG